MGAEMGTIASQKRTISRAAKEAGVHIETIRYYERIGLLPPRRNSDGYRVYNEDEIRRIRFIRNCQSFGFSLREIKDLLDVRDDAEATCGDVCMPAQRKIEELEEKIRALLEIRDELRRLSACASECISVKDCGLMKAVEERD